MRQTTMAKEATIERKWYVVDAEGLTLGRLASEVATVLRGKHKPTYTPHVDTGDYVIIVNAEKVVMTGKKLDSVKYYRHTSRQHYKKQKEFWLMKQLVKKMLTHHLIDLLVSCKN